MIPEIFCVHDKVKVYVCYYDDLTSIHVTVTVPMNAPKCKTLTRRKRKKQQLASYPGLSFPCRKKKGLGTRLAASIPASFFLIYLVSC